MTKRELQKMSTEELIRYYRHSLKAVNEIMETPSIVGMAIDHIKIMERIDEVMNERGEGDFNLTENGRI